MFLLCLSFLTALETAFSRASQMPGGHVPDGSLTTRPPRGRSPGVISGWGHPFPGEWDPKAAPLGAPPHRLLHLSGSPRSQLGRVRDRHVAGGARRDPAEEWATGTPGAVGGPGGERWSPLGSGSPDFGDRDRRASKKPSNTAGRGGPAPEQAPGSLQDRLPLNVPPHPESPGASHGQERDNRGLTLLSQDGVGDQPSALPVRGMARWLGATHLPPRPSAPGRWHPRTGARQGGHAGRGKSQRPHEPGPADTALKPVSRRADVFPKRSRCLSFVLERQPSQSPGRLSVALDGAIADMRNSR